MSFHDNILSRKGRPARLANAKEKQGIADEIQRVSAFDLIPPSTAPVAVGANADGGSRHHSEDAVELHPAGFAVSPEPPFSISALADRWNCSEGAVRNRIKSGQLGYFRVGNLYRVPAEEVARFECR